MTDDIRARALRQKALENWVRVALIGANLTGEVRPRWNEEKSPFRYEFPIHGVCVMESELQVKTFAGRVRTPSWSIQRFHIGDKGWVGNEVDNVVSPQEAAKLAVCEVVAKNVNKAIREAYRGVDHTVSPFDSPGRKPKPKRGPGRPPKAKPSQQIG